MHSELMEYFTSGELFLSKPIDFRASFTKLGALELILDIVRNNFEKNKLKRLKKIFSMVGFNFSTVSLHNLVDIQFC